MHVSQPKIATGVTEREPFVIHAHQVQDRRVKIVDMHRLVDRTETVFIGGSVGHATLDPRSREPR